MPAWVSSSAPSIAIDDPTKKYSVRLLPGRAGGSRQLAPGSMRSVQIARSDSSRAAQELGGGGGAETSPILPATIVMLVVASPDLNSSLGSFEPHSIVKYGSTSLSRAGKLSHS